MKKAFLSLILIGLLIGGVFQQAQAQDKTLEFNLNVGALKNAYGRHDMFTLGTGLDIHVGKLIMISPELQMWIGPDSFLLNPGAILNYEYKNVFVGGGVILTFFIFGDENLISGILWPKINAGLRFKWVKLTFYLITSFDGFSGNSQVGANIGIVF